MPQLSDLWPAFAAAFAALAAVRPAEALGRRLGLVDRPGGALKIHAEPTPRSGGVALLAGLLVAALVGWALDGPILNQREAAVGLLLFGLGVWDDKSPRSPKLRMVLQVAIYLFGYAVGLRAHPGWPAWGVFLSGLIWFVVVVNAANFYDGMDGLLSLTALAAFAVWGAAAGSFGIAPALTLAAAGALAGFLPRNWHPGRIFLGDGGSFLVGFMFYMTLVRGAEGGFGPVPGLLIAALPVCDAGAATLDRIARRTNVWTGDRDHLYDIMARLGLCPRSIALLLGLLSGLCALTAVVVAPLGTAVRWVTVVAVYVLLTAAVLAMRRRYRVGG
jgi:UDP-N-acetylmuramyl pentapeptide phosphotransferase/UDP-N-acetylglucosamine-1-phosphate transferase